MKKFFRVFYSQIFNSFFPVLIIAILLKLADSSKTASIFLLLNFANIYLLFSDYSSNTILLKDALQSGGITKENVSDDIIKDIESYIGVKIIILGLGFFIWLALCLFVPQLSQNLLSNILAYSFIIGYNMNFYWLYMSSSKEYFFIISNFLGRLFFLLLLLLYIFFKVDFFSLMPLAGLGTTLISLLIFKRFCAVYRINFRLSKATLQQAVLVIKRDWPLVANSFLMMTPTTCLSLFIGFIKNSSHVLVYAFAEKIFMAIRALISVFINAVYPVICQEGSVKTQRSNRILLFFYAAVIVGCTATYYFSPYIFNYLRQPAAFTNLFTKCLLYFLLTILVITFNVRPFLQLLVSNHFNYAKNFFLLLIGSVAIVLVFTINVFTNNSVASIAQSVLIAEAIIGLALVALNYFTRAKISR